jgi:DNA-binding NtrC family response regulator
MRELAALVGLLRLPERHERTHITMLARHLRTAALWALGKRTDQGAEQILMAARWPGNVRELHNCIERAVLLSGDQEPVARRHLPTAHTRRARGDRCARAGWAR